MALSTLVLALALAVPVAESGSLHDFKLKSIEGKDVDLAKFRGKVVLAVNVASKCGMTPQYEALEKLYLAKKAEGFVVLGFPANEFGGQEPGTDAEILEFCTGKYNVTFPMFSKIVVKGEGIHPLYKWLTDQTEKKEIEWNFAKFVIGKDGDVKGRFSPRTKPDAPEVLAAIDKALAEK
jgi:glutathione peroxidase